MTQNQIERRRRRIEQISREIVRMRAHKMSTVVVVNGVCHPSTATFVAASRLKRLLSLQRRVRRCPECAGIGSADEYSTHARGMIGYCETCGGTGRL